MDWTRVPVVAGGGQLTNRNEDPLEAPDPFELMTEASRLAARDAAPPAGHPSQDVLRDLTHVFMVHSLSLRHGDPAPEIARRIGAQNAEARCSGMGGSIPQWLVNRAAELVLAGARPRVLIVGVEALATRRRARQRGIRLEWPSSEGWPETWPPLEADMGFHAVERAHALDQATSAYALIESAVAHAAEEGPDAHARSMGALMARFNEVAARNPVSWFPTRRDAAEIMTVTPDNRMICHPYPKYVNAVMAVDMAAAVLITDAATARDWGLASDEVAYVRGFADAHDVWYLSERPAIHTSPALVECGRTAAATARIELSDVDAFDLYSCFPSSVEVARDSFDIGASDDRPLTLTGGLPYHGGPGNNYVTHSVANAAAWLRAGHGDHVLVHGNGYYLTKHAIGIYSRQPPADPVEAPEKLQQRVDELAAPLEVAHAARGPATVVGYTATYDREGRPEEAVVLVDTEHGRALSRGDDELTAALLGGDGVGTKVVLTPDGDVNRATAP